MMNGTGKKKYTGLYWLLRWLVGQEKARLLAGDFIELFQVMATEEGSAHAMLWLIRECCLSLGPILRRQLIWRTTMFANYIKIALRNFSRQRTYSLINLVGLVLGLICTLLIVSYVQHELSFDRHNLNSGRIYRVGTNLDFGSGPSGDLALSNYPVGKALKERLPQVEASARLRRAFDRAEVKAGGQAFMEDQAFFADQDVFNVFTLPLRVGVAESALAAPYTVAISHSTARKYFQDGDALGQVLTLGDTYEYEVTAVFDDVPVTSHVHFDLLFSFATLEAAMPEATSRWVGDFNNYTYLLLAPNADPADVEAAIPALVQAHLADLLKALNARIDMFLTPLPDIHLKAGLIAEIEPQGRMVYVQLFGAVAVFVFMLACINYMNLSTARAIRRLREMGLRKVMGSGRHELMLQILLESLGFTVLAAAIALLTVPLLLPWFRNLSGAMIVYQPFSMWMLGSLAGIVVLGGLLAGLYPAVLISRWTPQQLFLGQTVGRRKSRFRDVLVVGQFTVSIALMIGAALVGHQLNYMQNADLGFDEHQVLSLPMAGRLQTDLQSVKAELLDHPGIVAVGAASHMPGVGCRRNAFLPEGFELKQNIMMGAVSVEPDFLDAMGIEVKRGSNFLRYGSDNRRFYLVNETAAERMGFDDCVGKTLQELDGRQSSNTITGVVKNFHFESLHRLIEPLVLEYNPDNFYRLAVRVAPGAVPQVLAFLHEKWQTIAPERSFSYRFLDEVLQSRYESEAHLREVFDLFTILAMAIASLGLLGLAAYGAEQRVREVGIRKVLGASVGQLLFLLSKDAVRWVLLANVLAWPAAWFAMNRWMQNFPYRSSMPWTIFAGAALFSALLALLTVLSQSYRAAQANPAVSIRTD